MGTNFLRATGAALLLFFSFTMAQAQSDDAPEDLISLIASLPGEKTIINAPDIDALQPYGDGHRAEIIAAPEITGGRALRVEIGKGGGDAWSAGANADITGPIKDGDVLFYAFYARAVEADNEAQSGVISAFNIQKKGEDYDQIVATAALVPLGRWKLFYGADIARGDWPAGKAMIAYHLAGTAQVIDLGPAVVVNLGPGADVQSLPQQRLTYPGREANAPWRKAAQDRIRDIRMGTISLKVVDETGAPVKGARVQVKMTGHAFRFGTFLGHNFVNNKGKDFDRLRESFHDSFNFATAPLYWSDWGWQNADFRRNYMDMMKWLDAEDIPWRGHTILYPVKRLTPSKIVNAAGDRARASWLVLDHVREVTEATKPYGPCCYDVLNEPRTGGYLQEITSEETIVKAFQRANELNPDAVMYVNEFGLITGGGRHQENIDAYHGWISNMLAKGAPVEGIGFQGHFGADLTDPARVLEIFDDFARYGLPIQVTEFDVDTTDEEAQADFTRDMLTAVFSHPAADAFIVWEWWEGQHWRPNGAMLRRDWSEKPNYKVWMKLIYDDWWTDEEVVTGADGAASLRGFLGDYAVSVSHKGEEATQALTLSRDGASATVILGGD